MKNLRILLLLCLGGFAAAQNPNLSSTTPAAPSGGVNCLFQYSGVNVSCYIPSGTYDPANAAATALTSAETFSGNAANLTNGTIPVARLPLATSAAAGAVICGTGTSCASGVMSVAAGSGSGGAPAFTGDLSTGIIADYNFEQTTGTTLTDTSGNANNGTFIGSPSWSSTGRGLTTGATTGVTLPSALNAGETFVIALNYSTTNSYLTYETVLSSTLGEAGINLLMASPNAGGWFGTPNLFLNTTAAYGVTGFHVLTLVLGTSGASNHIYIDGQETPYYAVGTPAAGTQTSGNICLGTCNTGPWANQGGISTYYRMRVYSTQLTASDVYQISQNFTNDVNNWGIQTVPIQYPYATPQLICMGDSITSGNSVTPYCSLLSLTNQPAYNIQNQGMGNSSNPYLTAYAPQGSATKCKNLSGSPSVANIAMATNDMVGNTTTPTLGAAIVWQRLAANIRTMKLAGCKVFVSTMISRGTALDPGGNTIDADKDAINAIIRQQAIAVGADGITDNAANPLMGADGASTNGTYFSGDFTHPVLAGQTLMGATMSAALNYFFGTTAGNPTVVTATYSMLTGDRFVKLAPAAVATVTLPDCMGQTGAVYTINNPQSADAITLKNLTSVEPINGVDYSATGYTFPSNSTHTFTDVALPSTTAGCVWSMQ